MVSVPLRYQPYFRGGYILGKPTILTSVGPRQTLHYRWICRMCGLAIKTNTLGAQSHVTAHLKKEKEEKK